MKQRSMWSNKSNRTHSVALPVLCPTCRLLHSMILRRHQWDEHCRGDRSVFVAVVDEMYVTHQTLASSVHRRLLHWIRTLELEVWMYLFQIATASTICRIHSVAAVKIALAVDFSRSKYSCEDLVLHSDRIFRCTEAAFDFHIVAVHVAWIRAHPQYILQDGVHRSAPAQNMNHERYYHFEFQCVVSHRPLLDHPPNIQSDNSLALETENWTICIFHNWHTQREIVVRHQWATTLIIKLKRNRKQLEYTRLSRDLLFAYEPTHLLKPFYGDLWFSSGIKSKIECRSRWSLFENIPRSGSHSRYCSVFIQRSNVMAIAATRNRRSKWSIIS